MKGKNCVNYHWVIQFVSPQLLFFFFFFFSGAMTCSLSLTHPLTYYSQLFPFLSHKLFSLFLPIVFVRVRFQFFCHCFFAVNSLSSSFVVSNVVSHSLVSLSQSNVDIRKSYVLQHTQTHTHTCTEREKDTKINIYDCWVRTKKKYGTKRIAKILLCKNVYVCVHCPNRVE